MRPPPANERDDDHLDGLRIAVVDRLQERALLERAGHRVHVAEVLEAVGGSTEPMRTLERRVGGERGAGGDRLERRERAVLALDQHVDAAAGAGRDARVRRDERDEARFLDDAREVERRAIGHRAAGERHRQDVPLRADAELAAGRREPGVVAERQRGTAAAGRRCARRATRSART